MWQIDHGFANGRIRPPRRTNRAAGMRDLFGAPTATEGAGPRAARRDRASGAPRHGGGQGFAQEFDLGDEAGQAFAAGNRRHRR